MGKIFLMTLLFFSAITGDTLSADPQKDIAVIYNRKTHINADTVDFIDEQFKSYKIKYNVSDFSMEKAQNINTADYKAILLLNTGVTSGIDKTIADYINSCKEKPKLILITLLKDNRELTIETIEPSPATLGVDAVTGPSVWKSRGLLSYFGGKNSKEYDTHVEWIKHVLAIINRRNQ